jgi:hypothetical protein
MIVFEVSLNGKRVCVAGAEDLGVLTTSVTAVGKLGNRTVPLRPDQTGGEIHYSIGGLTSRKNPDKDVHVRWKSVAPLGVGDVIQVKILEGEKADRAISRQKAKSRTIKKAKGC